MTLQPAEVALSADLPLPVTVLGLGWVGAAMVARLLDQAAPLEINVRVPSPRHLGAWLDLADAAVLRRGHRLLLNDEAAWRRAAVVFHCAGAANPTGVSRHSVAEHNLALTGEVFAGGGFAAPPWVIVIANPVDLVAGLLTRLPGLDPARVIGTGTYLDTIRMQREIAVALNRAPAEVEAWVLGEHGEAQVPVWSRIRVAGLPATDLLDAAARDGLARLTREAAWRIRGTQPGTWWGVTACAAEIFAALRGGPLLRRPLGLPIAGAWAERLGHAGLVLSLPAEVDAAGCRLIQDFRLEPGEEAALRAAAAVLAGAEASTLGRAGSHQGTEVRSIP